MRRDGGSRRHDDRCAGTRTPTHARPRRTGSHQTDSTRTQKEKKKREAGGRLGAPNTAARPPVAVCCSAGSSGSARVGGTTALPAAGNPQFSRPRCELTLMTLGRLTGQSRKIWVRPRYGFRKYLRHTGLVSAWAGLRAENSTGGGLGGQRVPPPPPIYFLGNIIKIYPNFG
jgi:hypothetical protein